ncbi:hypothetical protein [Psychrobacillus phage Perkons]|nr:hypothetical protein [Psychrobacillus phage Perkons]
MYDFKNTISLLTEVMLEIKEYLEKVENGEVEEPTTGEVINMKYLYSEYESAKIVLSDFNK